MPVPVAHAAPGGPALSLGLVRLPATDAARRVGSLVVNPGGPGASGVELAEVIAATLDPAVRARYDVVGFDPRGVGSSSGLDCGVGDRLLAPAAASLEGQVRFADALAAACEAEQPSLLPSLSTAAVARDLDAVRAAVGDERLDFLGFSYGSTLGATYAELFPERVGRMVLDGPASPNASYADWVGTQLTSFQAVLGRFFAACDAQLRCPLHGRTAVTWHDLAALAGAGGLAAGDGAVLDRDGFLDATTDVLYQGSDSYELLAGLLANAVAGDASGLAELAARDSGISAAAYYGVVCGDDPTRLTATEITARTEALRAGAPDFAGGLREVATCSAVPPAGEPRPTIGLAPGQITRPLIVATTNDPATPYAEASSLAEALGGAALLTYEGDGHTIVGRGNACVDEAVTAYLTTGALPPDGARCQPVSAVGVVLTEGGGGHGAVVSGFSTDSPAQGMLAVGDVIRQVNGQPVTEPMQLERVARSGAQLVLAVDRGSRQLTVTLQPQAPAYWSP